MSDPKDCPNWPDPCPPECHHDCDAKIERLKAAIETHRDAHLPRITQPGVQSAADKANEELWGALSDEQ